MLEKLEKDPSKIPSPSRDEMMSMFQAAWSKTTSAIDPEAAFKSLGITIKLDGSEDHLINSTLKSLVGKEMFEWRKKLLDSKPANSMQELESRITPPDGVKRKFLTDAGAPFDEVNNVNKNIYRD